MPKSLRIIIGISFVLIVGGILILPRFTPPRDADMRTGTPMPNFALKSYDGKTVTSDDFKGAPLVINAWAAWCPFCVKELPDLAAAQEEFGDAVRIIAIDRAESRATAKAYTDGLGVTDALIFLLDPSDSFYRSIGGFSMPETIFIDAEGYIQFHKRGPMELPEIRQRIQSLISES